MMECIEVNVEIFPKGIYELFERNTYKRTVCELFESYVGIILQRNVGVV